MGLPLLWAIESGPGILALVGLVFAGTTVRANSVLETWSASDRLAVAFANGLDYLFGILLFGTLALGCVWVATRRGASTSTAAILVWLASLAVVLVIPENAAYLMMVLGDTGAPWPQCAFAASVPRFIIFFACVGFIGIGEARRPTRHCS